MTEVPVCPASPFFCVPSGGHSVVQGSKLAGLSLCLLFSSGFNSQVMKQLLSLAAMGCSLSLIEAGGFKWNSNKAHDLGGYTPAHETGDLQMQLQPVTANPEPTSPPELRRSKVPVAERRDSTVPGSVCGYMSHDLGKSTAYRPLTIYLDIKDLPRGDS